MPTMPLKAVFLDFDTLAPADLDPTPLEHALPGIVLVPETRPAEIAARLAGAQVAVVNKIKLDAETLGAARHLQLVLLAATGTDNIDLQAARRLHIAVYNIRDYCTDSVTQHVFALLLSLLRHISDYRRVAIGGWSASHRFSPLDFPLRELNGLTLGIVGFGTLGRSVAALARAFGMQVLVSARPGSAAVPAGRRPFDELLADVDVLSLHCPLTADNRCLIDGRALARMRPGAVLINTARGGLVDADALREALLTGKLGGAGIDVLEPEPPPADHPLLDERIPNLIVTPHVAWASRAARQRAIVQIAANVQAFLEGGSRNRVV